MDNNPQINPGDYMPWSLYWPKYPQFFANKEAASHFIQTRKRAMMEAGVLLTASRGYIVNAPKLDGLLMALLTSTAPVLSPVETALRRLCKEFITLRDCAKAIDPEQSFIEFMAVVNALPDEDKPERHGAFNAGGQMTFNLPEALTWCERITARRGE